LDTAAGIFTLVGARITPDGTVLDLGGKVLREDFFNSGATNADLAFARSQYLLTWMGIDPATGGFTVRRERLTPSPNLIESVVTVARASTPHRDAPGVASNGSGYFVTWFENRFTGFAQVFGAGVSATGQVQDPNGIAVTGYSGYSQFPPAPAW